MASRKPKSEFPLIIEVNKTFPLRRIKEVYIEDPDRDFRDNITITKKQALYLYKALQEILKEDPEELDAKEESNKTSK
jgi:hypothetical protein